MPNKENRRPADQLINSRVGHEPNIKTREPLKPKKVNKTERCQEHDHQDREPIKLQSPAYAYVEYF